MQRVRLEEICTSFRPTRANGRQLAVLLCPAQLYANYFHKVPLVLHLDLRRDSHQPLTQAQITRDKIGDNTSPSNSEVKFKDEIHPRTRHGIPEGGVQVYLYSFFNLGAGWWVANATPRPLNPGKVTRYPFYKRLGGESDQVPILQEAGRGK